MAKEKPPTQQVAAAEQRADADAGGNVVAAHAGTGAAAGAASRYSIAASAPQFSLGTLQ
jgi:hypothetical protein